MIRFRSILLPMLLVLPAYSEEPAPRVAPSSKTARSLPEVVAFLGKPGSVAVIQNELLQFGDAAIDELLAGLHPLERKEELREDDLAAQNVVYRIRALRYLTSTDFIAETSHRFGKSPAQASRRQELFGSPRCKGKGIPFFGEWMSRGIVYLAPIDTQQRIIDQWREWARSPNRKIKVAQDLNDWWC